MRIAIIVAAYNCFGEDLASSMVSEGGHEVIPIIFAHSTEPEIKDGLEMAWDRNFIVANYGFNRGLARSWNEGIGLSIDLNCDAIIITNDDVIFGRKDIDNLAEYALSHRELAHISAFGFNEYHDQRMPAGFSCFAINPIAINTVGYFDVNFWPAYYEDCDYSWRASLFNLGFGGCEGTNIRHTSSGTIRKDQELATQNVGYMMANQRYYRAKWGDLNGGEVFRNPFDNSEIGPEIARERMGHPYLALDRTDMDWEWLERASDGAWANLHLY